MVSWYTYIEVEVSGVASQGASPVEMLLEIYDEGSLVGSAEQKGVKLGTKYFVSLELGGPNGNEDGADLGEHTLQGRVVLSNPEGEVEYWSDELTVGIGQEPTGEVF